jgi:hypothetical protein
LDVLRGCLRSQFFWVEEAITWGDPADDAVIDAFVLDVNADINSKLEQINATRSYIYLNDAETDQAVFQGYPAENLAKLKSIRAKYDPLKIYTNLMPGGFKVEHA